MAENNIKKDVSNIINIKDNLKGKKLLRILVDLILSNENKVVKEAVFGVIPKEKLESIKSSFSDKDIIYDNVIFKRARNSYLHHYRRIIKPLLKLIEIHSNNAHCQKIIDSISIIKNF